MSQQYQKQKLKWIEKGKLEQKKEELKKWRKFKKDFCSYRSCDACSINLEKIDKIINFFKDEVGREMTKEELSSER